MVLATKVTQQFNHTEIVLWTIIKDSSSEFKHIFVHELKRIGKLPPKTELKWVKFHSAETFDKSL